MGRRAEPTKLKILRGNPGKRRLDGEPQPPRADLTIPEGLGSIGSLVWTDISKLLDQLGIVTQADLHALHTYCRAHDEIAACDEEIQNEGGYYTTDKGTKCQHPAVNQRFKWLDIKRRYEIEFGMTPSSRAGIKTNAKPQNKLSKYLS